MDEHEKLILRSKLNRLPELVEQSKLIPDIEKGNDVPLARIKNSNWQQLVSHPLTMLQLNLPHSNQGNALEWKVRNGEARQLLVSGRFTNSKGASEPLLLPYGSFPRLLLLWLCVTVQFKGVRNVFLGHSIAAIFEKLGFDRQGQRYETLNLHLPRLMHSEMVISRYFPEIGDYDIGNEEKYPFQGEATRIEKQHLVNIVDNFKNKKSDGQAYYIYLSESFYNAITENPLPIDLNHVKQLAKDGGSYRLDIYSFLAERLHHIPENEPVQIERNDIADLFGAGASDKSRFFRETFKKNLDAVREIYSQANIEMHKGGLVLYRSPPPLNTSDIPLL